MIRFAGIRCTICGLAIEDGEVSRSFTLFTCNRASPLFLFSDSTCHSECVSLHPFGPQAVAIDDAVRYSYRPENRVCWVCAEQIRNPDDYIGLGFLTDDASLEASEFNFFHAHRDHLQEWAQTKTLMAALRDLVRSDGWEGDALDEEIRDLISLTLPPDG